MSSEPFERKHGLPERPPELIALATDVALLLHVATLCDGEVDLHGARANLVELYTRAVAISTLLGPKTPPVPVLAVIATAAEEACALRELEAWAKRVAAAAPPSEAEPAPLDVAPYGQWTPQALANYMAAVYRPANSPTARGVTPPAALAIADFYDAARGRLAAETGDATDGR